MLKNTANEDMTIRSATLLPSIWALMVALFLVAQFTYVNAQEEVDNKSSAVTCSRISRNNDFLFLTFEAQPDRSKNGKIVLRLHNNSTCSVIITSGSAENFLKPLPPSPGLMDVVNREIEYTLPDNVYVPELQYKFNAFGRDRKAIGGDSLFGFKLRPRHSILFDVDIRHLGSVGKGNSVSVEFQYDWELLDQTGNIYPSIEHRILFWTDSLPDKVKSRLAGR